MMKELWEKLGFTNREIEEEIEKSGIAGEALIENDNGNDVVQVSEVNEIAIEPDEDIEPVRGGPKLEKGSADLEG
ncbi:hypothetical protein V6N13_122403 [Hibiscus sabdariffa]